MFLSQFKEDLVSSVKKMILRESKLSAYFTLAIIVFVLSFLFFPNKTIIRNYYYIFIFAPALYAIYALRDRLDLRQPDMFLWGLLFFVCALSGTLVYLKYIIYAAALILLASRVVPGEFFRIPVVVRGFFWVEIIHVFVSVLFYWLLGKYTFGDRMIDPLGIMNCINTSIFLSACLMLVFPFWVSEKRWIELGAGLILSVISIVYILQSRSGLAAMLPIFILLPGYVWHKRELRFYIVGLMLVTVLLMCLMIWMAPEFVSRMGSYRGEIWQKLLADWKECSYLFGCGTSFVSQQTFGVDERITHVHNIYFAFMLYNGLPALFVFLGLCFYSLYKAWKNRDPWGGYLLATMIGLNFNGGPIIDRPNSFWILIILPIAIIANSRKMNNPICQNSTDTCVENEEYKR